MKPIPHPDSMRYKLISILMRDPLKTMAMTRALRTVGRRTLSAANTVALQAYLAREASRGLLSTASVRRPRSTLRTAMVAHVFYPDLIDEILACHANMPEGTALHLTAPQDSAARLAPRIAGRPDIVLKPVENRGRDIAPFLEVLRSGALDDCDAVLKIHSKRSPHLGHGDLLRRSMFTALAGRPDTVGRILDVMAERPGTPPAGLVGWRHVFLQHGRHWHTNRGRVSAVSTRLDPPARPDLAFFGGSMFWFRPAALASIAALPVVTEDFEVEAGQIDGTLHHALERCFAIAAAAAGYATCDTHGNVLLSPAPGSNPGPRGRR